MYKWEFRWVAGAGVQWDVQLATGFVTESLVTATKVAATFSSWECSAAHPPTGTSRQTLEDGENVRKPRSWEMTGCERG